MNFTESNQQTGSCIEPRLSQRTGRPAGDASNIIPFPLARASRQRPERAKLRGLSLPLRQAVHKVKEAVLRLARKRGPTTAAAAHYAQQQHAPAQDHRGRTIRERMSA
jgi:hypothetical protein